VLCVYHAVSAYEFDREVAINIEYDERTAERAMRMHADRCAFRGIIPARALPRLQIFSFPTGCGKTIMAALAASLMVMNEELWERTRRNFRADAVAAHVQNASGIAMVPGATTRLARLSIVTCPPSQLEHWTAALRAAVEAVAAHDPRRNARAELRIGVGEGRSLAQCGEEPAVWLMEETPASANVLMCSPGVAYVCRVIDEMLTVRRTNYQSQPSLCVGTTLIVQATVQSLPLNYEGGCTMNVLRDALGGRFPEPPTLSIVQRHYDAAVQSWAEVNYRNRGGSCGGKFSELSRSLKAHAHLRTMLPPAFLRQGLVADLIARFPPGLLVLHVQFSHATLSSMSGNGLDIVDVETYVCGLLRHLTAHAAGGRRESDARALEAIAAEFRGEFVAGRVAAAT
jgi:hypothetical protein